MFYNRICVFCLMQLTSVFLVFSQSYQSYSVVYSKRDVEAYYLHPNKSDNSGHKYSLTCSRELPLQCKVVLEFDLYTLNRTFEYAYLSNDYKNTTGSFSVYKTKVDFDNIFLKFKANYSTYYYYTEESDSLAVWIKELSVKGFYNSNFSDFDSNKKRSITFKHCDHMYNFTILNEFGKNVYETNHKNFFIRVGSKPVHPIHCSLSKYLTPITPVAIPVTEKTKTTEKSTVLKDSVDKKIKSATSNKTTENTTNMNVNMIPNTSKTLEVDTANNPNPSLHVNSTSTTARTTTKRNIRKITTVKNNIQPQTSKEEIPIDEKSNKSTIIITDNIKLLLIILISLIIIWILLTPLLIYCCKYRKKNTSKQSSKFSTKRIKSSYTQWLTSHTHLKESEQTRAPIEENVYSTPLEVKDCVQEDTNKDLKYEYDYVVVFRENKVLIENDYMVVEDKRLGTEDHRCVPKEYRRENNEDITAGGYMVMDSKKNCSSVDESGYLTPCVPASGSRKICDVGNEYMDIEYSKNK